jgi:large subunit ribosomal protein L14
MVYIKTILRVADNTGVKYVKCLRIVNSSLSTIHKQVGRPGDILLVSVKITKFLQKIKKGQLFKALVVRTKSPVIRNYGFLNFYENAVILLTKKMEPLGNRIFGPIAREALEQNFVKFASIRIRDV